MQPTDLVDHQNLRDDVPDFDAGDSLKVHVRVVEGNRQRVQLFEGVVIKRQGSGVRETFTVRKLSFGVGVERTFPVHSPIIDRIEVGARGDVRRAKLYYLRDRVGKRAKVKEKREFCPRNGGVAKARRHVGNTSGQRRRLVQHPRCQWRRMSGASTGTMTMCPSPDGISWLQPGHR